MLIAKRGNSLAVRLPRKLVERLGLRAGDELAIVAATGDRIEVAKDGRRERTLAAIRARNWALPPDYGFDREGANAH